jgi:hypothetical protein
MLLVYETYDATSLRGITVLGGLTLVYVTLCYLFMRPMMLVYEALSY